MTDSGTDRVRIRAIQSRALWVSLLGSIAIGCGALVQGHAASALVFGTLAAASGVSLIAVRGRGLAAPVSASSRRGIWQMALLTVG